MALDLHEVVLQVAVGVRVAVGEEHGVVVVLELDGEGQRVRRVVLVVLVGAIAGTSKLWFCD